MKFSRIIVLISLVAIAGCGGSGDTAERSAEAVTNTSTPSAEAVTNTSAEVEVFTAKPLPSYGLDTGDALKDELDVAMWVINGKTTDGATEIPLASRAGITPNPAAIDKGYLPKGVDPCNIPYSALIRPMYEQCFAEGMSMTEVSNIVGWQGEEISRAGEKVAYQWNDTDGGSMVIEFDDGHLVSMRQLGLKP